MIAELGDEDCLEQVGDLAVVDVARGHSGRLGDVITKLSGALKSTVSPNNFEYINQQKE